MREQKNIFQHIDLGAFGLYLLLMLIGWLSIYAAVYDQEHGNMLDMSQNYGKQAVWIATSLLIFALVQAINFRIFESISIIGYLVVLGLLVAVALFGKEVNGARAWFEIGTFRLQPAEFGKFTTCMALSAYLSQEVNLQQLKVKAIATIIILLPAALLMLQPDTGSALVFFSFIFVLYREGLSGNYLLIGALSILFVVLSLIIDKLILISIISSITIFYITFSRKKLQSTKQLLPLTILSIGLILSVDYAFDNILEPHQQKRINVLLGRETDIKGAGYNVHQSLIAIGSGGFSGKGFLQGTQTKFNFVPEQSTDFIFCTIGEEWGFLGSVFILMLFGALLIRVLQISERQTNSYARIYGYGVASILFFHVFINIGMAIGLLPVIGIPLPFISYGGSSLWSFTILLAILLKLDSARKLTF